MKIASRLGVREVLHFIFPAHPLDRRRPDEILGEQVEAFQAAGFTVSLIGDDVIQEGARLRGMPARSSVVYRGWMLTPDEYERLVAAIESADATAFISKQEYLAAHYLPNWYPLIADFTPETRVYPLDIDIERELRALGWNSFFIKDYVKSLKTSVGSFVRDPAEIAKVLEEMAHYRGEIEGGICVRRVEDFLPESEKRYFVIDAQPFAAELSDVIPDVVGICAARVPSKFFSVDVVQRRDGELRVVEVGDGQVSDLVGWSAGALARAWTAAMRGN
jgi:ATP-grasp domain, R2K clade family 3